MPTYIKVIKNKCIGCGKCYQIAPEIFDFDDEGLAQVFLDDNMGASPLQKHLTKKARLSVKACPTDAIEINDK